MHKLTFCSYFRKRLESISNGVLFLRQKSECVSTSIFLEVARDSLSNIIPHDNDLVHPGSSAVVPENGFENVVSLVRLNNNRVAVCNELPGIA